MHNPVFKSCVIYSHRLEVLSASREVHVFKPSTIVLTPPKLGALREVVCDNIIAVAEGEHAESKTSLQK